MSYNVNVKNALFANNSCDSLGSALFVDSNVNGAALVREERSAVP